jgi:hypothetical protein
LVLAIENAEARNVSISNDLSAANTERKPIASVSLKVRLLLLAILLAGILAIIGPSFTDMRGARQEFIQELCHRDASAHPDLCK